MEMVNFCLGQRLEMLNVGNLCLFLPPAKLKIKNAQYDKGLPHYVKPLLFLVHRFNTFTKTCSLPGSALGPGVEAQEAPSLDP